MAAVAVSLFDRAKVLATDQGRPVSLRLSDLLDSALEELNEEESARALPGHDLPWRQWAERYAKTLLSHEPPPHHVKAWEWAESLEPEVTPPALILAWNRGAAKSGVMQGFCCRWAFTLKRRFVLVISETQEQAQKFVSTVAETLEVAGVKPLRNPLGQTRGWRQNMIRTADGFNLIGVGWDVAMRGIRLGALRPDVMFFDDVDGRLDTPQMTAKKEAIITQTFLPAGAPGLAVAFGQNVILSGGLMDQVVQGTAQFLTHRRVSFVRAVEGLEIGFRDNGDGTQSPCIAEGTPSWPDRLGIEALNGFLHGMGVRAFLREFQHEVAEQGGGLWDGMAFRYAEDLASVPGLTLLENGLPRFEQIAVAVDPSGSRRGDEAGIVAAGSFRLPGGTLAAIVLEDISAQMSPKLWAQESIALYRRIGATKLLCERNFGGELVEDNLKGFPGAPPITMVTVTNGKIIRAEPIHQRYESGLVWHAKRMQGLEGQMTDWSPGSKQPSPGALDAAVIALSVLFGVADYVKAEKKSASAPYAAILSSGPVGGAKITRPSAKKSAARALWGTTNK